MGYSGVLPEGLTEDRLPVPLGYFPVPDIELDGLPVPLGYLPVPVRYFPVLNATPELEGK